MTLTYTPNDYKLHLLYSYYFISGKWKYYRLFIGFLCTLNGTILLSFHSSDKFSLQLGTVIVAYGVYYLLRPVYTVLVKKFTAESISFEFSDTSLLVHDKFGEASLNLKEYPLQANKRYDFINLDNSQKLFVPKSKLTQQQSFKFESRLKQD